MPNDTAAVDHGTRTKRKVCVLSVKYPLEHRALLEAVQERRGDGSLSRTMAAALDAFIELYYPRSIRKDA